MSRGIKFRAWIPAKEVGPHDYHSDGKATMFYQDDQYLQSFLRRAYMEDCGREHETHGVEAEAVRYDFSFVLPKNMEYNAVGDD